MKRPAAGPHTSTTQPPQPAQKPATPDWARGTGLPADGPLAALVAQPRWCCWAWHPVFRKRDGAWIWTKKPLGAPRDDRQPWALAVNRAEQQGRDYEQYVALCPVPSGSSSVRRPKAANCSAR